MRLAKGNDEFWNKSNGKLDKFITGDPVRNKIRVIKSKKVEGHCRNTWQHRNYRKKMHLGQWWDMTAITAKLHPWIFLKVWIEVQGHSGLGIGLSDSGTKTFNFLPSRHYLSSHQKHCFCVSILILGRYFYSLPFPTW